MKVHVLTIGDEILIGQIIDTNSSWIAQRLNLIGMKVSQMKSISDELKDIKSQLQLSLNEVDVVIITGGLGPTKDDITKKALAFVDLSPESISMKSIQTKDPKAHKCTKECMKDGKCAEMKKKG